MKVLLLKAVLLLKLLQHKEEKLLKKEMLLVLLLLERINNLGLMQDFYLEIKFGSIIKLLLHHVMRLLINVALL